MPARTLRYSTNATFSLLGSLPYSHSVLNAILLSFRTAWPLLLTGGGRRILAGGSLAWPVFKALVTPPIKHSGNEPVRVGL
jgi:hypothetical protein